MHRSLFEPDYSSTTTFPRFSVIPCHAIPASQQHQQQQRQRPRSLSLFQIKKQVHFSPCEGNQIYWIQRRDSQKLSVRTEAVLNRIAIIQVMIQKERDELQSLAMIESELAIRCNELLQDCHHAGLIRVLDAKKVRIVLEARLHHLTRDIGTMRKETLHFKSQTKTILAVTSQKLRDQDAASKKRLDLMELLLKQVGSPFAREASRNSTSHMSSPESMESTARCA